MFLLVSAKVLILLSHTHVKNVNSFYYLFVRLINILIYKRKYKISLIYTNTHAISIDKVVVTVQRFRRFSIVVFRLPQRE